MKLVIRDMIMEEDSLYVLQIINQYNDEPINLESFKQNQNNFNHSPLIKRIVLELNKRIIGFGFVVSGLPYINPGYLYERIVVDVHYQRQGFGGMIQSALWNSVIKAKPQGIQTFVSETNTESKKWAEKYGFVVKDAQFESVLDLTSKSLSSIKVQLNQHEKKGLTFKTMENYQGQENFELLCELFRSLLKDTPDCNGTEMGKEMAISLLKTFHPENIILAVIDNRWAGMTLMDKRNNNVVYNYFTGTIAEMRGKGIALALKLQAISKCIPLGFTQMRTNNFSSNSPMLAVNNKLGFVKKSGKWILTKKLVW